MSRRGVRDVVVVGGGVVGAACALALAAQDLDVVLVEARPPAGWTPAAPDLRVYAFAHDNARLLAQVGAWDAVRAARAHPYRRMRVWDAGGGSELVFDADALGMRELGWIVEHGLLVDRLWARLAAAGVEVRSPATVEALETAAGSVALRLADGPRIEARLAIAADGAGSALRRLAGIGAQAHDYGQSGVVGYVRGERPHADTAWQRFLPTGPLALLPCGDGSCSIVWTLPADEAARVRGLDDAAFSDALTRASEGRFGRLAPVSARAAFPLRRQLVDTQLAGRVLVVGDAAHVVHPLAGQGVNLGLRDVAGLAATVAQARGRGAAWDAPHRLARWARTRRSDNTVAAYAFDAINRVYSTDALAPTLLRSHALGIAQALPPLRNLLWARAAGR
ncbi:FAD-dependent oxidoreductase [Luteimonas sp. FCS-9]|uniref:FAD-dependent oxidoreductase n=1 Tax=Luteimonas sp. FCS-9 TaxID=1547516 RepID=UPI00063EB81F|nr:FAD-dependent oxidoreductase [Luteimonas sp. FCS-9]KLI99638.1 2-octaprenyl-3-methyl-6-methoxy-1,4-benzoquinol hydroxylase [Luteimonas sp. FCS-9]